MTCSNCGGVMIGDGYTEVVRCEFAEEEDYWYVEPDAQPVSCRLNAYDARPKLDLTYAS